jgi:flagellin
MSLRIQTNVEAFRAHRNLANTQAEGSKSMEKLSSGFRINRAADDAAGLAISESLRAQVRGLDQASRNVADGISLVQTAEGSLEQVHAMLQRVRELAVQYQNGTLQASDKAAITAEAEQLSAEVTRIAESTKFNGLSLFDGTNTQVTIQVGTGGSSTLDQVKVDMFDLGASVDTPTVFDLTSATVIADIDQAITDVSAGRGTLGAAQNRLEYTQAQIGISEENLSDSLSRIKDVDMASEMVKFTKSQILQQAGTSMLAQANQAPQAVLQLLK